MYVVNQHYVVNKKRNNNLKAELSHLFINQH